MGTDPFGRETSDDPLKEMGWTSTEGAPATVAPGAEVDGRPGESGDPSGGFIGALPGTEQRPSVHRSTRTIHVTRRGRRLVSSLTVLAFFGIVAAFVVPPIIDAIEAVDEVTKPFRESRDVDRPRKPDFRREGPASGLSSNSMLLRGNLSPALKELQRVTSGNRLVFARIDAGKVDVQVVTPDNRIEFATSESPDSARVWSTGARTGSLKPFPWSALNPSAPRRLVEGMTVKRGAKAAQFDYAVLINTGSTIGLGWSAWLKNGSTWTADADGKGVRKIG